MPHKITLENLAVMVQRGFKELRDEFGERFKEVDSKLKQINGNLVDIKSDTSYLKARANELSRKTDLHEDLLENHERRIKTLEASA